MEAAVTICVSHYDRLVGERGLSVEGTDANYTVAEQRALAEALVRMWAIVGLPDLLDQFDIVQVEQELLYPLAVGITLMSRPDAILREKRGGDLYVLSFKTATEFDKRKAKECQHDDQGISEVVAVERALGERVLGVRYEFLLKGRRAEYPKGSGRWVQWGPLIRGYRKDGEWAANYEWVDEESGMKRRLGKGWDRIDVWDSFGVREWINWLAENDRTTLAKQLVVPMPFYRHQEELDSWVRQRSMQEHIAAANALHVEAHRKRQSDAFPAALDVTFPQNRRSCDYPGACQFQDVCYGPISPAAPLIGDAFVRRIPHHTAECERQSPTKDNPNGDDDPELDCSTAPERNDGQ